VVALNAHGDVVPPRPRLDARPVRARRSKRVRTGRPCMAAALPCRSPTLRPMRFALLALRDAAAQGAKLGGTVELQFTYDEEVSGVVGPKWLLDQGLTKRTSSWRLAFPIGSSPRTTAACSSRSR